MARQKLDEKIDEVTFDYLAKLHEQVVGATSTLKQDNKRIATEAANICKRLGLRVNVTEVKADSIYTYIYFDGNIGGNIRERLDEELQKRFGPYCQSVAFH